MKSFRLAHQNKFLAVFLAVVVFSTSTAGGAILASWLLGADEAKAATASVGAGPDVAKLLAAIKIVPPKLSFNFSAMPDLKVSAFNLLGPALQAKGLVGFAVDPSLKFDGDAAIAPPDVSSMITPMPQGGPVPAPTTQPPTGSVPPAGTTPTSPSTGGQPPAGTTGMVISPEACAQFRGVPSCSMIGDPNGASYCGQCKAAGY